MRYTERLRHIRKEAQTRWYYFFLVVSFTLVVFAFAVYLRSDYVVTHFMDISVQPFMDADPPHMETVGLLNGQVESNSGGFVAGEELIITAVIYLRQDWWGKFKRLFPQVGEKTIITGSERIADYQKNLRALYQRHGLDSIIITQGTIPLISIDDSKRTAVFSGKIVSTLSGSLRFGDPLKFILEPLKMDDFGLEVAPRYVLHQIEANKRFEALNFVMLAIGALALFFAARDRSKRG